MRLWRVSVILAWAAACSAPYSEEPSVVPASQGDAGTNADSAIEAAATPDARDAAVIMRRYVYVVAGQSNGTNGLVPTPDVSYAEARSDGEIGPWQRGVPLPQPVHRLSAVAVDDAVVAIGGERSLSIAAGSKNVDHSVVFANGVLGGFLATTELLEPARRDHAAVVVDRRVYVIGGQAGGGTSIAGVDVASVLVGGKIGSWFEAVPLPESRSRAMAVHHDGWIYVLGGVVLAASGSQAGCGTQVIASRIRSDGLLDPWRLLPASISRSSAAAVAHEGKLYVIGGQACGLAPDDTPVLIADFLPNGELSQFAPSSKLPARRWSHGALAVGRWLFVFGGDTEMGLTGEVLRAPLTMTGTLGAFTSTTGLPAARGYFGYAER